MARHFYSITYYKRRNEYVVRCTYINIINNFLVLISYSVHNNIITMSYYIVLYIILFFFIKYAFCSTVNGFYTIFSWIEGIFYFPTQV